MAIDYTPSLGQYTTLAPFRYWCQKVLPLVYDDSLSYYELLNKVVDYLNMTMADVETLHDDVEGLHAAYVQLQTYVNNYFDNLDVQQEIDNKLDQMAADGYFTALVRPLLPDAVGDWLDEHITPTTPAIDNTLTVSGAAADALTAGQQIRRNTAFIRSAVMPLVSGFIDSLGNVDYNDMRACVMPEYLTGNDFDILNFEIKDGYTLRISYLNENDQFVYGNPHTKSFKYQIFSNRKYKISVFKTGGGNITVDEAYENITASFWTPSIKDYNGIKFTELPWTPYGLLNYNNPRISFPETDTGFEYTRCSCMLPLPESGIRICRSAKHYRQTAPFFNTFFYRLDENGNPVPASDYAATNASNANSSTWITDNCYFPYAEGVYFAVTLYANNFDLNDWTDYIECCFGSGEDKLTVSNLFPVSVILVGGTEIDLRDENYSSQTYQQNVCTIVDLSQVDYVVCSPEYSIFGEIYNVDRETNAASKSTFAAYANVNTEIFGVNFIDLTEYTHGTALIAIRKSAIRGVNASTGNITRVHPYIGGIYNIDDIRHNVQIIGNNRNVVCESALNSIIADNIKLLQKTVVKSMLDHYYPRAWSTANRKRIYEQDNFSSPFYAGYIGANRLYADITPHTYLTAMQDINSRGYIFGDPLQPDEIGNWGYGLTCNLLDNVAEGLTESYGTFNLAYSPNDKFTSEELDGEFNKIKAGDIIIRRDDFNGGNVNDGHCMLVTGVYSNNGVIDCITCLEGIPPFARFTAFCNTGAYGSVTDYPVNTFYTGYGRLNRFTHVARLKDKYIKPLQGNIPIDLDPVIGPVTVDRGDKSIYLPGMNVFATIHDDTDAFTINRNGSQIASIGVGTPSINNLTGKVIDIGEYVTDPGTYTINTSQGLSCTFYVPAVGTVTAETQTDNIVIESDSSNELLFAVSYYEHPDIEGKTALTTAPEDITNNTFTIPRTITKPGSANHGDHLYTMCVYAYKVDGVFIGTYWTDDTGESGVNFNSKHYE